MIYIIILCNLINPARDRGADEDGERDEARCCLRPEVRSFGAIRLAVWREEQRVCAANRSGDRGFVTPNELLRRAPPKWTGLARMGRRYRVRILSRIQNIRIRLYLCHV